MNDSFSEEGLWWLEGDDKNQVPGTLSFDLEDGPVLKLLGTLQDFVTAFNASLSGDSENLTIHGVTKKGKPVTLLRAFSTNRQMNMPGIANETWNSNMLLVGCHLSKSDDAIFSKSYLRFQEIEKWLEHNPFTFSFETESKVATLRAEKPREIYFATVDDFEITTVGNLYSNNDIDTRYSIEVLSQMGIRPTEAKSLDWHLNRAVRIQGLASLCSGYHLPLLSLELRGPDVEVGIGETMTCEVHVYARMQHPVADKWRRHDKPIVSGPELLRFNPDAAAVWFSEHENLGSALDLLFTIKGQRQMYTNVRFILAVQALEVFHRRTSAQTVMDQANFEKVREELIAAIPDSATKEMRERLIQSYRFTNEPSLSQRLKSIARTIKDEFGKLPPALNKSFIKQLVDTRNYYTHFSPDLEEKKLDGSGMYWASRRIIVLLTVLLLRRLGVSADDIGGLIRRHREFAQLWESENAPF
ncbi:HEPN domain-containing protein [Sphingomonas sp. J315]|uniref:ApeA N-terminal domain 1-containing protein n=1 Tax=Sphingomonas sp. J315 TaxID=2898433 RepID=UPI0021AD71E4|nr:HEPN domain-containing protein [Sphingomonas sp. J315]UUY00019.1 hypothetical protein LRS08_02445 [Sphingomonas sp. J315]